jgi:LuxR family maltose regulon positive regulatory protein
MTTPLLTTKLYVPPPCPNLVPRPGLTERPNEGISGQDCSFGRNPGFTHKLTLISALAGFGKTTLVSEWINQSL